MVQTPVKHLLIQKAAKYAAQYLGEPRLPSPVLRDRLDRYRGALSEVG
jgi:hypothetical protein